jgi:hypothetical protein
MVKRLVATLKFYPTGPRNSTRATRLPTFGLSFFRGSIDDSLFCVQPWAFGHRTAHEAA